jgi:fibronectin-binding autotransporter adhesin
MAGTNLNVSNTVGGLGTIADLGATQDGARTFTNGSPGGNVGDQVQILISQDGTFSDATYLCTVTGGDPAQTPITKEGKAPAFRYVRTYRTAVANSASPSFVVEAGSPVSDTGNGGATNWLLGGNPTGPASIGLLDGSTFTVGGLSANSTTAIASGATAPITLTAANALSLTATAGNVTQRATAGGFSFGANTALPATGVGQFNVNVSAAWAFQTGGTQQAVGGTGGLLLAGGGTAGVSIGAGAAAAATVANTFSLVTGAAGTIQIGHEANAHTVNVADDGTTTQVVTVGSNFGASSILLKSGTAGFALNAALPAGSGVTIDTPTAGGALLLGAANATSFTLGGTVAGSGLVQVGAAAILSIVVGAAGQVRLGAVTALYTNTADSIQVRTVNNGSITMVAAGSGNATFDSGSAGAVLLGNTNADAFTLGAGAAVVGTIRAATLNVNVGLASTVSIATGAVVQSVTVGSTNTTSATSILGGTTGGIGIGVASPGSGGTQVEAPINSGTLTIGVNTLVTNIGGGGAATVTLRSGGALGVGDNAAAQTITIGNATGATSLALKAAAGGFTLTNNGVTWTWPTADGVAGAVGGGSYLTSNGAGALSWRQTQSGTATLTSGTVTVAMNVTANTRITIGLKGAPAALTTLLVTGTRTIGTPGSVVFNGLVAALTVNGADNTTSFDWRADG